MLERGRRHGAAAKLRQHLEYLWRSCSQAASGVASAMDARRVATARRRHAQHDSAPGRPKYATCAKYK
ncbi:hypothetical protein DR88_5229 [Klebsiella pneumoniae]|nr:hypothetical protein DR88_5229 [Klebsiella pneumoniae]RLO14277.1 hypothetical protein D1220_28560 [Klebsiella pneumoniae]